MIVFISYYPENYRFSAPRVRVDAIKKNLEELGPVLVIQAAPFRRIAAYLKLFSIRFRNIRGVYIEPTTSSAYPWDFLVLALFRIMRVPVSIYIRDAYPKFREFRENISWYQVPLYWGWHVSVYLFHFFATRTYYPTGALAALFSPRRGDLLPPGAEIRPDMFSESSNNMLYAGGISKHYGMDIMLRMMQEIRKNNANITLYILNARVEESEEMKNHGVKVFRGNMADLAGTGLQFFLALSPRERTEYNNLALPVKIFDYIGAGLPVLVSECDEQAGFIKESGYGMVCNASGADFARSVMELLGDRKKLLAFHQQIKADVPKSHSWLVRAAKIRSDLDKWNYQYRWTKGRSKELKSPKN
jgi:glycosyltransferase involved in cell wall biosynthesis